MGNVDNVRVVLVGDSGVGKTCLTHLIAYNDSLLHPSWTVGCSIEVKLHRYKEGTPQQSSYFIELFDIGGSLSHKNTRCIFYNQIHGIILVHDLTNRKSHENLREWLYEMLNKEGKDTVKSTSGGYSSAPVFDPEQFLGTTQIPIIVIGTKLDLTDQRKQPKLVQKAGCIAEECGAEEIWLNCHETRSLAAGSTDAVKLTRFFDKVIEKKSKTRELNSCSHLDRRKFMSPSPYAQREDSVL